MQHNSIANFTIGVSGRYTMTRVKDGQPVESITFNNLITDAGLTQLLIGSNQTNTLAVGTGTSTPTATDVSLQQRVAYTTAKESYSATYNAATGSIDSTATYIFPVGAIQTNITEVGLFAVNYNYIDTTPIFSRSLIKDGNGNPTSITVLADEQLYVAYTVSLYPGEVDYQNATVGDYNVIVRPAHARTASPTPEAGLAWGTMQYGNLTSWNSYLQSNSTTRLSASDITDATSAPTYSHGGSGISSYEQISPGVVQFTTVVSPTAGNVPGGIRSICIVGGIGVIQIGFTPNIPKTADDRLTLKYTVTMTRRG